MFVGITCPRCSQALKLPEERVGAQVRCPACRERFPFDAATLATATGDGSSEVRMRAAQERSGAIGRASSRLRELIAGWLGLQSDVGKGATDVSNLLSCLVGAALTVLLYLVVFPAVRTPLIEALFMVGWVPKAIVFLSSWSLAILVWKFFKVRSLQSTLIFDALPREFGDEINAENVEKFREHLLTLPVDVSSNFMFNRVQRGIDHYKSGRSAQEVGATLNTQAELDAMAVESSYTMLKSFIWAVPILGFIGTVLGIGESVLGFSNTLNESQSFDVVRDSLSGVTSGLSFAFNTTLIALAASIILMLPAHWLQKLEDDLLNSVSDYCNEELLGRLEQQVEVREEGTAAIVKEALSGVLAQQNETLGQWTQALAGIGDKLTADVARGLHQVEQDLQEGYKARAALFGDAIAEASERSNRSLEELTQGLQERWVALQDQTAGRVEEVLAKINDSGQESTREVRETLARAASAQEQMMGQLGPAQERQAQALSEVLARFEGSIGEVQQGLAQLHDRHAQGLERLAQSMETNLEGLGRRAGEGWDRVEQGLQERHRAQVEQLGGSVANVTERANEQLEALTRRLQESSAALQQETAQRCNELLASIGESGKSGMRELQEALNRSASGQEAQQRALSESLGRVDGSVNELQRGLEGLQQRHSEGLERLTRSLGESLSAIQEKSERDARARTGEIESATSAVGESVGRVDNLLNELQRNLAALQQRHADGLEQLTRSLGESLTAAHERAERDARARSSELDEKAGVLRQGITDLERRANEMTQQMGRLAPALEQQLGRLTGDLAQQAKDQLEALNRAGTGITGELRSVAEALERTTQSQTGSMENSLSSLRDVSSELMRTLPDSLTAQRSALDASREQCERLVDAQKRLVDNLDNLRTDENLARTLADLGGLAKNLSGDIDSLQRKLGENGVTDKGGFRLPFFKRGPAARN